MLVGLLLLGGTVPTASVTAPRGPTVAPGDPVALGMERGDSGSLPAALPRPDAMAAAGGQGRLIVNSTDPAIVPNTGLRTNITEYLAYPFSANSAFQVGAEETIGNYVAVFGIFQNDQTFPVPFFSVFSNLTDATVHLAYWSNLTLVGGASYEFELTLDRGTNWTLTLNGALFGGNASAATYDFRTTAATWRGGVSFSEVALYAGAPTTPSLLTIPLSLAVLRPAGWYLPQEARAYMVADQNGWGAEGRLQNGTLAPGELRTGQAIPILANGTDLWTGGPVAVSLGLGLSATTVTGTTDLIATLSVFGSGGTPLPGVSVYLTDRAGATFAPRSVLTNGTGFGRSILGAPNVSAPTTDLVIATVTLFGYYGEVGVELSIVPPLQLFLNLSPALPEVFVRGSLPLTLTATDRNGSPAPGVLLLSSVLGGLATITPFATTDMAGRGEFLFEASTVPGAVNVSILVVEPGYWGHLEVAVRVSLPPPSLWQLAAPYLELAALGAAALGAVLYVRWRRRKRPRIPIPALALPTEPAASPPVTRTPP